MQAYDSQQSSYLSAIASGYGTVASGYGQATEDSASSTKYPSQTAYYQAASAETPSYYTRWLFGLSVSPVLQTDWQCMKRLMSLRDEVEVFIDTALNLFSCNLFDVYIGTGQAQNTSVGK